MMKRILAALLLFTTLWASTAEAANYAGTGVVWQVMSGATAANVNGAGFNPANANFPTDGVIAGGTGSSSTVTPTSSYSFVAGDVGAWLFVPVQTNVTYATWCPIASVAGGVATLTSSIGSCVQIVNNRYVTNTVAGISTAATPTLTYGVDYSQQTAAQKTDTTGANTTTAFTDSGVTIGKNWVGNFIHIISGTGSPTVGWYECVSEVTATCTLDRTAGTSGTALTYYMGGAASLGSSTANQTDANFFAQGSATTSAATRFFIQGGSSVSYTALQNVTPTSGNSLWPVIIEGFAVTRGDRPTGATRPTMAMGAFDFAFSPTYDSFYNLQFTGTATYVVGMGTGSTMSGCYVINNSTTASHDALYVSGTGPGNKVLNSELVGERGYAINEHSASGVYSIYQGNYIHDSVTGIYISSGPDAIVSNVLSGIKTTGILFASSAYGDIITGNTFYGAENKLGIAIDSNGNEAAESLLVTNNIFYGLTTALNASTNQSVAVNDYNDFYNNTTNYTDWQVGTHDVTINPTFTSIVSTTGTTGTSATTVLTDSGKNFTTIGVVAGRDYVNVTSGTGQTNGIYGIVTVGTTILTLDNTIGTNSTGDLHYQITSGRNWGQTGLAQTTGFPQAFPSSNQSALTNGNFTIGASQYINAGGGGGASAYAWAK